MKPKILSALLAVCMLLSCVGAVYAAESNSQSLGENITWTYDYTNHVLTISGTGATIENLPTLYWVNKHFNTRTIIVEEGITYLGNGLFQDFSSLTKVVLPETLTEIGNGTFSNCTVLTEIDIPDGVRVIGDRAFAYSYRLANIHLPASLTTLGDDALKYTAISEISLPYGLTTIGDRVFSDCDSLVEITFPATVTSMGSDLFEGCESIQAITFTGDAPAISDKAFQNMKLTAFYPEGNSTWTDNVMRNYGGIISWQPMSAEGLNISGTLGTGIHWSIVGSKLTIIGEKGCAWPERLGALPWEPFGHIVTEVEISGVPTIPSRAFYEFTEMRSFTWPEGITSIGSYAFYRCTQLPSAPIPETVTSIGPSAFERCASIAYVNLPQQITQISDRCFYGCTSLKNITLPNNLKVISNYAFGNTGLLSVIVPGSVGSINGVSFGECPNLEHVFLREGTSWLALRAFDGSRAIDTMVFPSTVRYVEIDAFNNVGLGKTAYLGEFPEKAPPGGNYGTYYRKGDDSWDRVQWGPLYPVEDPLAYVPYAPETLTGPVTAVSDPDMAQRIDCKVPRGSQRIVFIPLTNSSHGTVLMQVNKDGSYTLLPDTYYTAAGIQVTLTSSATLIAVNNSRSFPDVGQGHWAKNEIDYMSARGFLAGKLDGDFDPGETITRKTVAMLLWRMEGSPEVSGTCPLTDVKQDRYHNAILWAYQAGVINGYTDGTFRPDADLTRQHLAAMLYRYAQYKGYAFQEGNNSTLENFSDHAKIYSWASEACQWALQYGMINGRADGTYDPQGNASRAQFAVILYRFLQKVHEV